MEMKNTLKGWQMGVIAALLMLMLSTMFMPAFHFNGDVIEDMYKCMIKTLRDSSGMWGDLFEESLDQAVEKYDADYKQDFNDDIEELKKEEGIDISKFSPIRIMTHSLIDYFTSKDADQEEIDEIKDDKTFKKFSKGYNCIRIVLIIDYVLALFTLIMVIAGFAAEWQKKTPLIISIVYSVLSILVFGYLRFGMFKILVRSQFSKIETLFEGIDLDIWNQMVLDTTKEYWKTYGGKILSCLYSVAFLVAFLAALMILIISIISLVVGKQEMVLDYDREYDYDGHIYDDDLDSRAGMTEPFSPQYSTEGYPAKFDPNMNKDIFPANESNNMNPFSEDPIPVTDTVSDIFSRNSAADAKNAAIPPVNTIPVIGKVCCTKGVAVGQGFQLPSDRKVIVGKSPSRTNLTVNHPSVSNVHCSIRYNPVNNTYIVKDHSTNGTFVNGNRMPKNVAIEYPAGTVLVLADGVNEITLG